MSPHRAGNPPATGSVFDVRGTAPECGRKLRTVLPAPREHSCEHRNFAHFRLHDKAETIGQQRAHHHPHFVFRWVFSGARLNIEVLLHHPGRQLRNQRPGLIPLYPVREKYVGSQRKIFRGQVAAARHKDVPTQRKIRVRLTANLTPLDGCCIELEPRSPVLRHRDRSSRHQHGRNPCAALHHNGFSGTDTGRRREVPISPEYSFPSPRLY
jgi:hypothetical protein